MKVVSLQLPSGPSMERLSLPFSPTELLWRYPLPWAPPPPSPLGDTKAQLPAGLPPEPRLWTREDVAVFLKWCEREFDLPNFDMDLFQMNGMFIAIVYMSTYMLFTYYVLVIKSVISFCSQVKPYAF